MLSQLLLQYIFIVIYLLLILFYSNTLAINCHGALLALRILYLLSYSIMT